MSQSSFWENLITMLAGATDVQTLLLLAPLLPNMCTPPDIGNFGLWLGVNAIASIVTTFRIDTVMLLDDETQE